MKYDIRYIQEHCSGCLRCQLACSRAYSGQFQPSEARIWIKTRQMGYQAGFTDNCSSCGLCADSCFFEALVKTPVEKEV